MIATVGRKAYGAEKTSTADLPLHGGKEGQPFPAYGPTCDRTMASLERAVKHARAGDGEELAALRRLHVALENSMFCPTNEKEARDA